MNHMKLCITHRERNRHWRKRVKFTHSAGDQLHRAGRLHPATACTKVPQVLPYPCSRRFPRRRSDHMPLAQVKRRRAFFGESSQPAQLPPPNLGFFFSTLIRTHVRRATDPRQQIPPIPPEFAALPRILPPILLICIGLRVPRSIPFRCQSHRDASLFDESLLSVLLDLRHVAPLFILVRGSLRLLPRPSSIAFAFAVEARSSASTQPPPTARAACLGLTRTSTALPRWP